MSIRLNDGSHFRVTDNKNTDLTSKSSFDSTKVQLQIDVDKDGKFDGEKDLTITDQVQLKNIFDKDKSNNNVLESIPFIDEIVEHLDKNEQINNLLSIAEKKGNEANKTSIFKLDKKLELGKEAFHSVKKSFEVDKANPDSRFAYGIALLKIKQSSFSSTAEKKMDINLSSLIKDITPELEKDKYDIIGQMLLSKIYEETNNPNKKSVDKNLSLLKQNNPEQYNSNLAFFNKILDS
jgi:hypothetical protein